MVHRYDPQLHSKSCPSCHHVEETQSHFLCCTHRIAWRSSFQTALRKHSEKTDTDPLLQEMMLEGIFRWLRHRPYPSLRSAFSASYNELFQRQADIGWEQLLYGRWSVQWRELQYQYLQQNNIAITKYNHGTPWLNGHIKLIWNQLYAAWELRNKDLHGKDEHMQRQRKQAQVQKQIRVLYHLKQDCQLINQRKWFYASPAEHFAREPQLGQQESWLAAYGPAIRARARIQRHLNQQGLQAIDAAFETITIRDNAPTDPPP